MIFWARSRFEWRLRTRSLHLGERTSVMAIVHLEPDSQRSLSGPTPAAAWAKVSIAEAVSAVDAGADIVDLHAIATAESAHSHPAVSPEQEQARLLPVLEGLMALRPTTVVSVDVCHASTARLAVRLGAEILNDLSAPGWDQAMAEVVARTGCGLILRHTRGRPREWLAEGPMSSDEVVPSVFSGLCERLAMAEAAGIHTDQIVADPGFSSGFGSRKRGAEDMALLAGLGRLRQLGRPLLVGFPLLGFPATGHPGNGSSVGSPDPNPSEDSDPTDPRSNDAHRTRIIAGNVAAILSGVHLLRVQDVHSAREAAALADAVLEASD
jgi:dihydropteroate synthase